MRREKSGEVDPLGLFGGGKAFRFLLAAGALAAVSLPPRAWAASIGTVGEFFPCPVDTLPIQIMTSGYGNSGIKSVAEIPRALPHLRTFVTAITEHVAAWLVRDGLCMDSAESRERSLLQFVYWPLFMRREHLVPVMDDFGASSPPGCRITSPWIDLVVDRRPAPLIRGVVYWNERQLLADQAVLTGAGNVPAGRAVPLTPSEFGHFISEYEDTEFSYPRNSYPRKSYPHNSYPRKSVTKPLEARVSPDILWLLRRAGRNERAGPFGGDVKQAMRQATEKGAEGYTKFVISLIDRCLASDGVNFHYNSILDAVDQYRIYMPVRQRFR
jgi:hypothetical protein